MLKWQNEEIKGWADYEFIDSGEGMKLERFGEIVLARPDTQALWQKSAPQKWRSADATFSMNESKGRWQKRASLNESWEIAHDKTKFHLHLGAFKHIGVFPEQVSNWNYIGAQVKKIKEPKVLNLFGYTGIATLAAVEAGAHVTHVDASKQSLDLASANATLSKLPKDKVRWIPDDALAFARREVRRGTHYDGIILDPPAFGRGAKGQVWHIEEDLAKLMGVLKDLLKDSPGSFLVLNGYAAGYSAASFAELVADYFPKLKGQFGELMLVQTEGDRRLSSGIFVRGNL